ncbi:YqaE/Pmp3 family membrane protein [Novispirillum sp. DQ9]|uniref:YqaE/Pmp3 family membrane protein n=1 Tax=Novispirillum sp. DQ9 TaxID=3398612 RepID=UPI003C7A43AE
MASPHGNSPITGRRDSTGADVLRIILAILLPPLGVFFQVGLGLHFWINILLTLLGYIPGIIHAIWVIARR